MLLVSGVQQSDSVIHIHISILFQILYPYRLLQDTDYSSLCYTVGPCCLSILYIVVCALANPKLPIYPSPAPLPHFSFKMGWRCASSQQQLKLQRHDFLPMEELGILLFCVILELTFQTVFLIFAVQKRYYLDLSFQEKQDKRIHIK